MFKQFVVVSFLLVGTATCVAGGDTYVAFDTLNCKRYSVEFGGGWPPDGYVRLNPNATIPQPFYWSIASVFSGNTSTSGLCKFVYQGSSWPKYAPAFCEEKPGFALSGASYAAASKNEPFNFRCKANCGLETIKWLYLEPNEVRGNPRYELARRQYFKTCGGENAL